MALNSQSENPDLIPTAAQYQNTHLFIRFSKIR